MTALERLLAEELPTGEFGGPCPYRAPRPPAWWEPISEEQATANRAALEAAIDGWSWDDDPRHHLHAVPDLREQAA